MVSKVLSPASMAHGAALISYSLALNRTPAEAARPGYGASASRGMPVYSQAFAGTH